MSVRTAKTGRMYVHQLRQAAKSEAWSTNSPLKGKIVLLGGMYHAARDSYSTPHGPRYGVELIAQALATEFAVAAFRSFRHSTRCYWISFWDQC